MKRLARDYNQRSSAKCNATPYLVRGPFATAQAIPPWTAIRPHTHTWSSSPNHRREEVPLKGYRFEIGLAAVVALVALRLSLGCHFLYEGVWKIKHPEFSAEPFLSEAKGPAAPLFYAMLWDIDGRERLAPQETMQKDANGRERTMLLVPYYTDAWDAFQVRVVEKYKLDDDQRAKTEQILAQQKSCLHAFFVENKADLERYFKNLDDFEVLKQDSNSTNAAFQKERIWKRQQELRAQVKGWLKEIAEIEKAGQDQMWDVLKDDQKARGRLPVRWTQVDLLNLAVTFALTAIGLCLMIGLCTRLAALGGAAFMVMVVLTQFPWPTVYPPAPAVVGHSLLVNKDFVEMVALLVVAATAVGRWGGLDFFLYHWLGRPLLARWEARKSSNDE